MYLAGKVDGEKWAVALPYSEEVRFVASDGSNHSEHSWGGGTFTFGEHEETVKECCLKVIAGCDFLVAYLDKDNSYGSIAEIAYASAVGKKCYLIICGEGDHEWEPPFYDSYWFISCFPNVKTTVVPRRLDAKAALQDILTLEKRGRRSHLYELMESPLERQFYDAFSSACEAITPKIGLTLTVTPQAVIRLHKTYRADFLIETDTLKVIVEVDGHDYHERTKEQARRDKERDRAMTAAGYHVLRFTGSEIYHNADKAAREVIKFLRSSVSA